MTNVVNKVVVDTNVLMSQEYFKFLENFISCEENTVIVPIKVSSELDNHNHGDDQARKYKARIGLRFLRKYQDQIVFDLENYQMDGLDCTKNDNQIILCAKANKAQLLTLDLTMELIAIQYGVEMFTCEIKEFKEAIYDGYKLVEFTDEEWVRKITVGLFGNEWDLLEDEYMVITKEGKPVEAVRWHDGKFKKLTRKGFKSNDIGSIEGKDLYQLCAIDSLLNDDITMLSGEAGTAKTLLSISYLMWALEQNKIKKIHIIHNPVPTHSSEKIGFVPGTAIEKLISGSSLGGILVSKLGGELAIEGLIKTNKLSIIPACQIRGMEIQKDEALYITESQNMNTYLMQTAIERCADGSKIIIEGDYKTQIDSSSSMYDNGLKSAINTLRGNIGVGIVTLQNKYRGRISALASKMTENR